MDVRWDGMGWIWVKRSRGEKLHRHGGCLARENETETENVVIIPSSRIPHPIPTVFTAYGDCIMLILSSCALYYYYI